MTPLTPTTKKGDVGVTPTVLNRPIANPTISYRTNAYQNSVEKWKKTKEETDDLDASLQ